MTLKRIQLGLIHVAITITLFPINSTLNRVMINELALSATLFAVLTSFPYLFSPIQVAIGAFSDRHPIFGWRRTPYILFGLLLCVAGVMVAPQVAFLMVEKRSMGILLGGLAFGAWGMGFNFASVSYLSLASELSGEKQRSRTIAVMFFMMILSIIAASLALGRMLEFYTPEILIRSFRVMGVVALVLGLIGVTGLEPRNRQYPAPEESHSWREMIGVLTSNRQATRFFVYLVILLIAILGQDILLEPYAAQAFGMPVEQTTRITSIWGTFFLISLSLGGALENQVPKLKQAQIGGWIGAAAFGLIVLSSITVSQSIFYLGVVLLGFATGISTVSNLSLMLDMTTDGQVGLYIGAWGMANAISRLVGNLLSGGLRDAVTRFANDAVTGYSVVFFIEILLLLVSLNLLRSIDVNLFRQNAKQDISFVERAAIANEV